MSTGIRIDGVERTLLAFGRLERGIARKVVPKAVRAGGSVQLKATRQQAPKKNRLLSRSLTMVLRRYNGAVYAVIGQQVRKTVNVKKLKHSGGISGQGNVVPIHLVENPVKAHEITGSPWLRFNLNGRQVWAKRVLHPGHSGRHFAQRAADQTRGAAEAAFEVKFINELNKEVPAV